MDTVYCKLIAKETRLSLIGLGYVGLPIALEFASKISVIGFDISQKRIDMMKNHVDPSNELPGEAFEKKDILFTTDPEELRKASFHIVAVPTPIDDHNMPDLKPLLSATISVGKILKKGDYVVFESTVYPGATEEDCIPLLEKYSGLTFNEDFKVGYSPERINPGDAKHTLTNVVKIVSGCDEEALEVIAKVYELVVKAGVHKASSIKVAEAAKVIENTQRDVNIALMNELSIIFNRMGINTYDVLEAAGTKWNFLKFAPGLVGGHCIGVDPYYLDYKAREYKYHTQIIRAGRYINDSIGLFISKQIVKHLTGFGKTILGLKALVMGITFKENVSDVRNSKVVDVVNELKSYGMSVDVVDPLASPEEVKREYDITLKQDIGNHYDTIIVAVSHKEYCGFDEAFFENIATENALFVDIKGIYRGRIRKLKYWSL